MIGQCLCEKITFEFDPRDGLAVNCHCSLCRRSHGAAFATQVISYKSSLKFLSGEEFLKEYHSPGGIRAFCSECGSRLMNYAVAHQYMSVALSAVVDAEDIQPSANIFVGSKASWYQPREGIQCFDAFPDDLEKYL